MKWTRYNIIMAIIAIVGFILIAASINQLFRYKSLNPLLFENFLHILLVSLTLIVLTGWVWCGIIFSLTFFSLSTITVLLAAWASNRIIYLMHIPLIAATSAVAYYFGKDAQTHYSINQLRLQEMRENINTLAQHNEKSRLLAPVLQKKIENFSALKDITERLSSSLSVQDLADYLADKTFEIVGKSDNALLYLVDVQKQELALVAKRQSQDAYQIKLKKGDAYDAWVLKQRQSLIVQDSTKDYRFSDAVTEDEEGRFRALIISPLLSETKLLGTIRLESKNPGAYAQDDLRILNIISGLAAASIENAYLYKKTEELAIIDGLTGLYVHRYFYQRLGEEVQRAMHSGRRFAFLMLDIDNFKEYNDLYGHSAGDIVLKKTAQILSFVAGGAGNLVARYGGEEFAIVLVDRSKKEAISIADNIRAAVCEELFLLRRKKTNITISIGIAFFPDDAKTKEDLINKADEFLYIAKAKGKDKVCYA